MQLLVFRHGPAVDRERFAAGGSDDHARPLTDKGRRRVRRCAKGLKAVLPQLDQIFSSGLARAWQTAELLADVYGDVPIQHCPGLELEQPLEAFEAQLRELPASAAVAAVGHRPELEILVSWLIAGVTTPCLELEKSGSALIDFPGNVGQGHGVLRWALTARQARRIRT